MPRCFLDLFSAEKNQPQLGEIGHIGSARPAGFFCSSDTDCAGGTCSKLLNTGDNICEAKGEMKCISDSVIEFGTGAGTLASLEQRACSTTLTDGAMTIVACHQSKATR